MDAGYPGYNNENGMFEAEQIFAKLQRISNSKRKDEPQVNFLKQYMQKELKTGFNQIKTKMLRNISEVTQHFTLI